MNILSVKQRPVKTTLFCKNIQGYNNDKTKSPIYCGAKKEHPDAKYCKTCWEKIKQARTL